MLRIFTDPRCSLHRSPPGFPERQERLDAVMARLREGPWPVVAEVSEPGAGEAIAAVHGARYVQRLRAAVSQGGFLGSLAPYPFVVIPRDFLRPTAFRASQLDGDVDRDGSTES